MQEYHIILLRIKPQFESLTSKSWNISERLSIPDGMDRDIISDISTLEFMVYLRHIGFPSPLLDWTHSYYVASFFAFRELCFIKDKPDNVAIFMFIKDVGNGREGAYGGGPDKWKNNKNIIDIGQMLKTHPRHYLQQADYTYCIVCEDVGDISTYHYSPYPSFNPTYEDGKILQDKLLKFIIPSKEYKDVLKELNKMNINTYTLFNNEEGLAEKLAIEEMISF